ncbi:hypothetical protein [Desulfovibrio sp.]|uniref:hypothetical protein n=1 Tax=Desulfovibrio sp. TaxID=885 RepID=UPI0025BC9B24|nr:hypothetical protein [Desulfovibrio sp.]
MDQVESFRWLLRRKARIDPLRVFKVPVLERQSFRDPCDRSATLLAAAAPVPGMRVIATGNVNLVDTMREESFRSDLYWGGGVPLP